MHDEARVAGWSAFWRRRWRSVVIPLCLLVAVVVMLKIWGPDGATYDEYLQLHEGMSRQEAVDIIGQGDYWFHNEGDLTVTSWVNADGTYIRAVFDKQDVLVEVSWESGWDATREQQ